MSLPFSVKQMPGLPGLVSLKREGLDAAAACSATSAMLNCTVEEEKQQQQQQCQVDV